MKTQSRLSEFAHELLVGGKHTGIILAKPEYKFAELKKLFPAIKKTDSVWYEFVKSPVAKQVRTHDSHEVVPASLSIKDALLKSGIRITKVN